MDWTQGLIANEEVDDSLSKETVFPAMQPEEGSCGAIVENWIDFEMCSINLNWICQKESVLI